jgi:hypothetical protein
MFRPARRTAEDGWSIGATPPIEGIGAGRDELLEAALREISSGRAP